MDKSVKQAYFQINGGGIQEYAYFDENYNSSVSEFQLNSSLSFNFNPQTRILTSLCGVTVNQNGLPVVKCTISFEYALTLETVQDFSVSKKIEIPQEILVYFGTNSLGALRGAIMARLETTRFKFILPPVNLNDIIKEPLTISDKI